MIMYKADHLSLKIEKVEVEKATIMSVWINGRRVARTTVYDTIHDTWHDAYRELLNKNERKMDLAKTNLQYEIEKRKKILNIIEP